MNKNWIYLIVILILACVIGIYFVSQKGYTYKNEYQENGITFESDYNISELISGYKDNNLWVLYMDVTNLKARGNEYACSILYNEVLTAHKYGFLNIMKMTDESNNTYCWAYDAKTKKTQNYGVSECEALKNTNFVIDFDSENSTNEVILDQNKVKISTTKEDGYAVCTFFLNLYFDTDAVGTAIKTKIDSIDGTNLIDYNKLKN